MFVTFHTLDQEMRPTRVGESGAPPHLFAGAKRRPNLKFFVYAFAVFGPIFLNARVKAVVIVPVADLLGKPVVNFLPAGKTVSSYYDELAYAPDKGIDSHFRLHQAKFNEIVTVISSLDKEEVCCEFENFFFLNSPAGSKKQQCWILRKNLTTLKELKSKVADIHLPAPIKMDQEPTHSNKGVLTLIEPWCDEESKRTFSVGTRFVRAHERDTVMSYAIYLLTAALEPEPLTETVAFIPKDLARVDYPSNFNEGRALFISLIRTWAHPQQGITPYVFGGCSFTGPVSNTKAVRKKTMHCGRYATCWHRTGNHEKPLSGFDCSNMLLCAAQIACLPYYFKNTQALMRGLKTVASDEKIEEGDLIWYPGHVMMVSDVKKNLLIEAGGYEFGHGKVHEISLNKVFHGIKTYQELLNAFRSSRFLRRLNSSGRPVRSIYKLKIFKLSSIVS